MTRSSVIVGAGLVGLSGMVFAGTDTPTTPAALIAETAVMVAAKASVASADPAVMPVGLISHHQEMAARFGSTPAVRISDHFAMLSAADEDSPASVTATLLLLEQTHNEFYHALELSGFKPRPLTDRLVWISFGNIEQFNRYARETDRMDLSWLDSYYSARTNRVVTNRCSPERTTHEAAHQLAFNSGLQKRGVMYPLWVSEGLATNFEADTVGAMGLDHDNATRRERLLKARAAGRLVPLADFLTLARPPAHQAEAANDLYAQCWAAFRFLFQHRRAELRRYLLTLSQLEPGWRDPATLQSEIVAAFGPVALLTEPWGRFLAELDPPPRSTDAPQLAAHAIESPTQAP